MRVLKLLKCARSDNRRPSRYIATMLRWLLWRSRILRRCAKIRRSVTWRHCHVASIDVVEVRMLVITWDWGK